ncbi:MAG TPA: DUF2318 domain-containing protein [Blastocatellia bacterium]|nr:DUF2318 domain-containing protein [Blastocatellia bacterium]
MPNQPQAREQKRAQFSESPKAKSKTTPALIAIAVALAAVAAYFVIKASSDKPAATTVTSGAARGAAAGEDIRIPLSDLSATAKFFDYTLADNKQLRFFALRSSDGVYRAALDACDTCYHAKKGYHQQGDDMICNNCGLHFHSAQINEVHGGCNPVGLPRAIDGDYLVIKASDLESRKQYF